MSTLVSDAVWTLVSDAVVPSEATAMVVGAADVVDVVDVVEVVDVVLTTISVGASSASSVTFCVVSDCAPPQAVTTTSIPTSVARRIPVIIPPLPVPARSR